MQHFVLLTDYSELEPVDGLHGDVLDFEPAGGSEGRVNVTLYVHLGVLALLGLDPQERVVKEVKVSCSELARQAHRLANGRVVQLGARQHVEAPP